MNVDRELNYRPLSVWVIRNKDGAFAPRTKIYPSKAGGTMGFNSFVEWQLEYYFDIHNRNDHIDALIHHWIFGGRKDFGSYDKIRADIKRGGRFRSPVDVSRSNYDIFMRVIEKIHDEWKVEEITQQYA